MDVEAIRRGLKSDQAATRDSALKVIVNHQLRELAQDVLEAFLPERNSYIKGRCAWALGRLNHSPALPDLITGLNDDGDDVRKWCAWALGELGSREAEAALTRALDKELEGKIRQVIGGALRKCRLESVRPHKGVIERKLRRPKTENPELLAVLRELDKLTFPKDSKRIIELRERILALDPAYFRLYMDWVRRRPKLESLLENENKTFTD